MWKKLEKFILLENRLEISSKRLYVEYNVGNLNALFDTSKILLSVYQKQTEQNDLFVRSVARNSRLESNFFVKPCIASWV